MLPPDENPEDDPFGPDFGPGELENQAVLAQVPTDFYEQLAPLLQLCAVANFLLLGRPADPVPQAIRQLTGFDLAAAARVSRLRDSGSLGCLLVQEPETLYDFILVGQLVFESPLLAEVSRLLEAPDEPQQPASPEDSSADSDLVAECLRAFVTGLSAAVLTNLGECLDRQPAPGPDLHLRHLQLESIFIRLADTLLPAQLTSSAGPASSASTGTAAVRVTAQGAAAQLEALQLALALPPRLAGQPGWATRAAASGSAMPPGLVPDARPLPQRLQAWVPGQAQQLSWWATLQLYRAAQMCALALVSGSLDGVNLPTLTAPVAGNSRPAQLPAYCAALENFVGLVQATFPDEPALPAIRREVERLADLF